MLWTSRQDPQPTFDYTRKSIQNIQRYLQKVRCATLAYKEDFLGDRGILPALSPTLEHCDFANHRAKTYVKFLGYRCKFSMIKIHLRSLDLRKTFDII